MARTVIAAALVGALSGGVVAWGVARGSVSRLEFANGSHIWSRNDKALALHLRSPNTYDPEAKTGAYSQCNFYPDSIWCWGGTQPGGRVIALDQNGLSAPQGRLNIGTHRHPFGDLWLDRTAYLGSLRGEGVRFVCANEHGALVAQEAPCR